MVHMLHSPFSSPYFCCLKHNLKQVNVINGAIILPRLPRSPRLPRFAPLSYLYFTMHRFRGVWPFIGRLFIIKTVVEIDLQVCLKTKCVYLFSSAYVCSLKKLLVKLASKCAWQIHFSLKFKFNLVVVEIHLQECLKTKCVCFFSSVQVCLLKNWN